MIEIRKHGFELALKVALGLGFGQAGSPKLEDGKGQDQKSRSDQ